MVDLVRAGRSPNDLAREFEPTAQSISDWGAMLEKIVEPLLAAREAMWREFAKLHREVLSIVKEDQVCRRLMTVPGVGALVSLTYRAGVDDPGRFTKSKSVGS